MKKKIKICFISKELYPYLAKTKLEKAGGAERQQFLLAEEFQNRGLNVSFIVKHYNKKKIKTINGFKIYKSFYLFQHIPILRLYFDFLLLLLAMKKSNADIYYQRILSYETVFTAFICKLLNKKFIFSIGTIWSSKIDILNKLNPITRSLFKFGLLNSNIIITQANFQRKNLKRNFNRDCIIIKNIYPMEDYIPRKSRPPIILWVGSMKTRKDPLSFLKLAKLFPEATFKLIGGPGNDEAYYNRIKNESKKIKNVQFLGYIPPHEIKKYYEEASIFINTSSSEGFPNTFIEAWIRYVPVVSLYIDPDESICKNKLGFHSKTFKKMIKQLRILIENESLRSEMGINCRNYVENEHDIKKVYKKYSKLFEKLINQ